MEKLLLDGAQKAEKEHNSPCGDAGIGHIEGRPMVVAQVEVNEICDFSITHSVYEVPCGPSQDEGEGVSVPEAMGREPSVKIDYQYCRGDGDHEEKGEDC